jgi:hypothetical protein
MQAADIDAERARKNRALAAALFAVTLLVLGLMVSVVFGLRSGVLPKFVEHAARSLMG